MIIKLLIIILLIKISNAYISLHNALILALCVIYYNITTINTPSIIVKHRNTEVSKKNIKKLKSILKGKQTEQKKKKVKISVISNQEYIIKKLYELINILKKNNSVFITVNTIFDKEILTIFEVKSFLNFISVHDDYRLLINISYEIKDKLDIMNEEEIENLEHIIDNHVDNKILYMYYSYAKLFEMIRI